MAKKPEAPQMPTATAPLVAESAGPDQAELSAQAVDRAAEQRLAAVQEPVLDPLARSGPAPVVPDPETQERSDIPRYREPQVQDVAEPQTFDVPIEWDVSVPGSPIHRVEAKTKEEAIENYKLWANVVKSEHPFAARPVMDSPVTIARLTKAE